MFSRPTAHATRAASVAVVATALVTGTLLGVPGANADPSARAKATSSISGKLRVAGPDKRLAGAAVVAYRRSSSGRWVREGKARVTRTGRFTVKRVPAGRYRLLAKPTSGEQAPRWFGGPTLWEGAASPRTLTKTGGTSFKVKAGRSSTGHRTTVASAGRAAVEFVDDRGLKPVVGVVAYRRVVDGAAGAWRTMPAWADPGFGNLQPGVHTLRYRPAAGGAWRTSTIVVKARSTTRAALRLPAAIQSLGKPLLVSPGSYFPTVGDTLQISSGTDAFNYPNAVLTLSYQWYRAGVAIPGATRPSYTIVDADRSKGLRVRLTASRPGYTPVSIDSRSVDVARSATTTLLSLSRSSVLFGDTDTVTASARVTAADGGPVAGTVYFGAGPRCEDGDSSCPSYRWDASVRVNASGVAAVRLPRTLGVVSQIEASFEPSVTPGFAAASEARPARITVVPRASRTSVSLASKTVKRGARPTVTVKVSVPGGVKRRQVVGTIVVTANGKKVGSFRSRHFPHAEKFKIRLKKFPRKGTYKIRAQFVAASTPQTYGIRSGAKSSTSKPVKLRVR